MAVLSLFGANGQLYIYDDHLEIHRKGIAARLTHLKSKHTIIEYSELTRVKMKLGVFPISGYFYFEKDNDSKDCGLYTAAQDEDCIVFRASENEKAKEIKQYLNKKI